MLLIKAVDKPDKIYRVIKKKRVDFDSLFDIALIKM